jgi:hypothetical protein
MPESIGSKKRVLPAGVVCDKCNNYFARKVEHPVLNHPWMRNLRAWQQVPNKKGTFPSMVGHVAGTDVPINMRRGRDGKPQFETEKQRDSQTLAQAIAGGFEQPLIFTIEDDPPQREMSRFLCKMALETVAELFCAGPRGTEQLVDETYFDSIRTFARYGSNFKKWPYSQRRVFPHDTLMRHPETNEWVQAGFGCGLFMNKRHETFFAFCLYGIEFVINVGGPSITGYQEWLKDHNGISPIVERLGCHLITEGEGSSQTHYLHGSFNAIKGVDFDRIHGCAYDAQHAN